MNSISDFFHSAVKKVTGKTPQEHADAVKAALSLPAAAVNDADSAKALGAAPEAAGKTMTGGRRHKTRKAGKRTKTHKRR